MSARTTRGARAARREVPVQAGLWGEDACAPNSRRVPAASTTPATNDPEQWARVLGGAAADPGYVVAAYGTRTGRRVMARTAGAAPGEVDRVTPLPPGEAAVVLAALDAGHVALGAGERPVRHGRHERPARRVLVPARTRCLLARWAALAPLTDTGKD